jgi:outer membrane murein-binding lipoprotein Lpp
MQKLTILAAALAAVTLAGCQTTQPTKPAPLPPSADAEVLSRISASAQQATASMERLNAMRVSGRSVTPETSAIPAGLEVPVSIEWTGPLPGLIQKVAAMTGYSYGGELGSRPAIPVTVAVKQVDRTAWFLIESADSQAHPAANIIVRPDSKELLVQYPPVTQSGGYPNVVAK